MTRLLGWIGLLALAIAGLHASPIPPGGGVDAAFAGVRFLALGLGYYLLAVTVLGLVTRALRVGAAVRVTDLVTVPFVRRLLNGAASVVVVASLAAPTAAVVVASPAIAAAAPSEASPAAPPVMHLLDDTPAPAPATPEPEPASPRDAEYVVKPGDNFWSIAGNVLGEQLARAATDDEIVPYWQALIAANADRVRDPSLVFSGQVLRIPPSVQPPAAGSGMALPRTE